MCVFIIFMSMDVNKIFNLFRVGEKRFPFYSQEELEELKRLENFKSTPAYKIGMFRKIIINHFMYKNRIINMFKDVKPSLNTYELEEAGDMITYDRGWDFIKQCDLKDEKWKKCLEVNNTEEFKTSLDLSINHYQDMEEYEKCAYLKKILDFVERDLEVED